MAGDVISLIDRTTGGDQEMLGRLESVLAILDAIHAGELLAALPESEDAQHQHRVALSPLALAQRELQAICDAGN